MKLEQLRQRLVLASRHTPEDARVPEGFAQRVSHAIRSAPPPDPWLAWLHDFRRATLLASSVAAMATVLHLLVPPPWIARPGEVIDPDPLGEAFLGDVSGLLEESFSDEPAP